MGSKMPQHSQEADSSDDGGADELPIPRNVYAPPGTAAQNPTCVTSRPFRATHNPAPRYCFYRSHECIQLCEVQTAFWEIVRKSGSSQVCTVTHLRTCSIPFRHHATQFRPCEAQMPNAGESQQTQRSRPSKHMKYGIRKASYCLRASRHYLATSC
jgi:hypothetical protein